MADEEGVERDELHARGRRAQDTIRGFLLEWDAIEAGTPDDEYDCMIGPLYGLVFKGSDKDQIAAWLADYRADHFGLPADAESDARLARRLVGAFPES